ncbi:uncharacterized protein MELLADRAFT_66419 [Melampsora larici-populina 98AG31]|uniref:SET domain-containing protein n=1 Tax=Melampsora larici-populina (strain 98AG31 / pathotype 3-4-7) TaxID=747676 RepID=F4RZ45_MELLP|nr:uncharacterized protein MELLADRAFT_66419 [Melampsora larici-populina 98AG31]EGG02383.1 hypothetical protein MELLADRAFT_66419 [Melampsora larici-populina 98AG31]
MVASLNAQLTYITVGCVLSQVYCGYPSHQPRLDTLRSPVPPLNTFDTSPAPRICNARQARLDSFQSPVPPLNIFGISPAPQPYVCNAIQPRLDSLRSPVHSLDVFGTTVLSLDLYGSTSSPQSCMCDATQSRPESLRSPVVPFMDVLGTTPGQQSYMCNATDLIAPTTPTKSISESRQLPKIGNFAQHECFENSFPGEEEHCLYVDTDFSDGRGISIFTRPSILRDEISQLPVFNSNSNVVTKADRASVPFAITPLPGKGNGALATRVISKGELIISDHAATVIDMETSAYNRQNFDDICVLAFDLLPYSTQSRLRKLDSVGHTRAALVQSAIERNAFESHHGGDERVLHYAVVPEPSIFNHECRPNSAFYFDNKTMRVYISAVRDIALGEEITIAYRDMKASKAERQTAIAHYGFKCTCTHCSMSPKESRASDQRIYEIDTIMGHLTDFNNDSKANLDMADRLIQLYREERFDDRIAEAYTLATMTYNSFGKISEVKKYANLARSAGLIAAGPAWSELPAIEEMQKDPKAHWTHNARHGMRSRNE